VSASILEEGVRTLRDGGTPPRTLVIDDGWQCTDVDPSFSKKQRPPPRAPASAPAAAAASSAPASSASPSASSSPPSPPPPPPPPGPGGGGVRGRGGAGGSTLLESVERAAESAGAAVEAAVGTFEADARAAAAVARAALDGAAAAAEYEFEAAERRALAAAAREAAPGTSLGAALAGLAPPPDSAVDAEDSEDDVGGGEAVARGVGSAYSGFDGEGEMSAIGSSSSESDSGSTSDGGGGGLGGERRTARRKGRAGRTVDAFPPLPEQHAPRGRPRPPTDLESLEAAAAAAAATSSPSSEAEAAAAEAEAAEGAGAALSAKNERNRYLTDSDSDETRSRLFSSSASFSPSKRRLLNSAPRRQPPRLPGVAGAAGGRAADLRSGPAAVGLAAIGAVFYLAAALQRAVGASLGGAEAAGAKLYAAVVEPAPAGSWQVRAFAAAARGPLRPALLEFYAAASDFTRRLTDVRANAKFSRPGATPEDYWSGAPERLGDVVADLKGRLGVRHVIVWHALSCYWGGVAPAGGGAGGGGDRGSSGAGAPPPPASPPSPSPGSSSSSSPPASASTSPALHPAVAKYDARILFARPTPGVAEIEPSMLWNPAVLAGVGVIADPKSLYADLHSYLAAAGVDGVKVDGQAGAGLIGSALDGGPATARRHQEALEESVAAHLPGNHLTNCMCHSTENLFLASRSVLARASDDFYPRDRASSAAHVGACAYNAVFLSGILLPDWDMFHSRHPAARLHAAARAVSGGPVYVSDAPGAHDFGLLRRLVLADGRVLRALLPARPTADTLFEDPQRDGRSLLKVWNANAHTVVVAALHVQGSAWSRERRRFVRHDDAPPPLGCRVSPADAVGGSWLPPQTKAGDGEEGEISSTLRFDGRWVAAFSGVDAHHHRHSKGASKGGTGGTGGTGGGGGIFLLASVGAAVDIELEGGGTSVVTMAPVAVVEGSNSSSLSEETISFAPLGLRSMFNGGGAVASFELLEGRESGEGEEEAGGTGRARARVGVVGAAPFSSFCSVRPSSVRGGEEGELQEDLEWRWDERCGELVVSPPPPPSAEASAVGDWSFEVLF